MRGAGEEEDISGGYSRELRKRRMALGESSRDVERRGPILGVLFESNVADYYVPPARKTQTSCIPYLTFFFHPLRISIPRKVVLCRGTSPLYNYKVGHWELGVILLIFALVQSVSRLFIKDVKIRRRRHQL